MKKFNKKHGLILLISMIILITALNTATAIEDNNTTHANDVNKMQTDTIEQDTANIQYQNNTRIQNDKIQSKTIKQENEYIQINQNNKDEYQYYEFEENSQIIINGTVNDLYMELTKPNISITGINNPKLINSIINVYDDGCIHLSNISFENDDECESTIDIYIETDNNILENLTFNEYREQIRDDLYRIIEVTGNNNTIRTSQFTVTYPAMHREWMYYGDDCKGDVISVHGDNNIIEDNYFEVYEGQPKEYPFGLTRTLSIYGNKNIINRNDIYMNGTLYLYAITIFYHENVITNNYMEVHSIRYASGIAINGESSYNIIKNNTIILTTQNESKELFGLVDAAYAIVLTENAYHGGSYNIINSKMEGNVIEDNNIMGYSNHMYGFEQFGGKDTVIRNNNIDIEGSAPMGIAVIGSDTQIEGNSINVRGYTNQSEDSLDYLKPQTTGIYLFYGNDATIIGNQITTDNGTAIRTLLESSTIIADNYMQVDNNIVTIDIQNPRGFTDIIGNIIADLENQIINGKNIYMEDNHDPNYQENPTDNPTSNNTTENIPDNATTNTTDDTPTNTTDTNLNNTNQTQENNQTENPIPEENNQTENITIPEEINQTENITIPEEINQTENITVPDEINQTENITIPEDINHTENITNLEEINQTQNTTIPDENNKTENITLPEEINQTENITIPEDINHTEIITSPEEINQTQNITVPDEINQSENITIPEDINKTEDITISEQNNETENITVPTDETNQTIPVLPEEEVKENITEPSVIENHTQEAVKENNTDSIDNRNETVINQETNKTTSDEHKQQNTDENNTSLINQTISNQDMNQTHKNQSNTEETNQTQPADIIIEDNNDLLENITIENQTVPEENNTSTITDKVEETNQTITMHNSTDNTNISISAGDTPEINSPADSLKPQPPINKVDTPIIDIDNQEMENTQTDSNQRDSTSQSSIMNEIKSESPDINNDNQDDESNSQAGDNPNEIQVTQTLPDSQKVYELNQKQIMKILDENIYAEIAFFVIMFISLLYGYISRNKIN